MTNIEEHSKEIMERIEQAGPGAAPARAHGSQVMRQHPPAVKDGGATIIIRLEALEANPHNLERMRKRVKQLNERLAQSGAPFRVRLV